MVCGSDYEESAKNTNRTKNAGSMMSFNAATLNNQGPNEELKLTFYAMPKGAVKYIAKTESYLLLHFSFIRYLTLDALSIEHLNN